MWGVVGVSLFRITAAAGSPRSAGLGREICEQPLERSFGLYFTLFRTRFGQKIENTRLFELNVR